jgi:hypothetical protein
MLRPARADPGWPRAAGRHVRTLTFASGAEPRVYGRQSIRACPLRSSAALAPENGLLPKKP